MAATGLVLLIVCANATGLLIARSVNRRREMAVRVALGASGLRLIMPLLAEGLVLAVPGAVGGLLLATWMLEGIFTLIRDAAWRREPGRSEFASRWALTEAACCGWSWVKSRS